MKAYTRQQTFGSGVNFRTAFEIGWLDGWHGARCDTPRETAKVYPEFTYDSITAYLNGADDGEARDTFRLNLARESVGLCTI
jgi:hypothetical protein